MISHPTADRDAWDEAEHAHCRCGARIIPISSPWNELLCAACGLGDPFCQCAPTACESCGGGPA